MPASALYYVSVNGGANQSGGVDVPSAAAIQLVAQSTTGWKQVRWEIYDYPEGFTAPVGWSTDTDGTIYSTAFVPPSFTLAANTVRWGKWMFRCLINDALSGIVDPNQTNSDTSISMLSPSGLRDVGAREASHWTSSTTRVKQWLRDFQRSARVVDSALSSFTSSIAGLNASVSANTTAIANIKTDVYDTWANRPAAGNKGRIFTPSDGYSQWVDDGSVWRPIFNGRVGTAPPAAATLTAVNTPTGMTFADDKGTLLIKQPQTASFNLGLIRLPSYPTPPFNLRIGFAVNLISANTVGWGVFLRDSATARIHALYKLFDTSQTKWFAQRASNPTTFVSSDIADVFPNYTGFERCFFHLTDPGGSGNLVWGNTQDGETANMVLSEQLQRNIYVANPDQFGICMYTNTTVTLSRGSVNLRIFDWTYQ